MIQRICCPKATQHDSKNHQQQNDIHMIRPIFLEPETLLDQCVFSQNQHTFIPAQPRIRRDVHIELSVFFQRKNIDVILFPDIDLPDRAIRPFRLPRCFSAL